MIAAHDLVRSTERSHRTLAEQLETAAAMEITPRQPRKPVEHVDAFLAATSRHLNAVESVVLPVAHKRVSDDVLVHDYVRASKDLETALVNVKGREYGSAYAVNMRWSDVGDAVRSCLEHERELELQLAEKVSGALDEAEVGALAEHLERAEPDAPSRPHPHAPHLGTRGRVARRVLHAIDSFWDTAESRMVPDKARPARKKPGRMGQYLLADPRFDEDER
jgi:hypothetical protein